MGQSYCKHCCGGERVDVGNLMIQSHQQDSPRMDFAQPVKMMIQISPKVKDTFLRIRTPHYAEKKGTKLNYFYLFKHAAYYDGQWKNGLPHGYGRLVYDDGSIYQGCFNIGEAQCHKAIFVRSNGSFYKGQIKRNMANGLGEMVSEHKNSKVIYKGYWLNDLPHGEGKQIFNGGMSYYDGNFVEGKKSGQGIYNWNLKEYYSGEFKDNKMEGYGQYHNKEYIYKGEFLNGKKHGIGNLQNLVKSEKYEGEFKQGSMEGKGIYYWKDGTKYEGIFKDNMRTQNGVMTLANGKVIKNPKLLPTTKSRVHQEIYLNESMQSQQNIPI